MIKLPLRTKSSDGFTLVEVLVIAPIMILTIIVLMSFLFNQYGQLTQEGAQLRLTTDAQLITLTMQDDVFFASAFANELNSNLVDPYAPSGGWTYTTTPPTIIISAPAMTANHRDPDRQPVYINTEGCDPDVISQNGVLDNNIIYFAEGTNLYRRIVSAPSTMATCGVSFLKQTCPTTNATDTCPEDTLLTDKLSEFSVQYYDYDNTEVTIPEQAQRVKVSVTLKDRAFAEDVYGSSTITLKKLN